MGHPQGYPSFRPKQILIEMSMISLNLFQIYFLNQYFMIVLNQLNLRQSILILLQISAKFPLQQDLLTRAEALGI